MPAPIRQRILAICSANLAPQGVAFVSYNTLPGWRIRGMIRDMMIYHCAPIHGAQAKVQQARVLLDFLAQGTPGDTPYGMVLRQEIELTRNEPDAYLFHDHLEEVNEPVYFHEFADAAARHGLQYLAEADFSTMLIANFPPPVAETLRRIGPDLVRVEQYMDFLRSRTFRETLLVHQGVAIKRKLDAQALPQFLVATLAHPVSGQHSLAEGAAESYRVPTGATLTTGNAITKAAMLLLAEQWPRAVPFAELLQGARARLATGAGSLADAATLAQDAAHLANDLMRSFVVGVVELRMRAPQLCAAPSARPSASPLARLQAEEGRPITNLRHEPAALDEPNRQLLRLLDGTRDRDALVAALAKLVQDGAIEVHQGGEALTSGPALETILRAGLEENLPKFARAALLVS